MKTKLTAPLLAQGHIVRKPVGDEKGYWVGAPGAFYAEDEFAWYLTYRIRRPRGVAPDRGGEARIARSTDLQNWQDIWTVTKDKYDSASIERSAIRKGKDGIWRYFTSFVDTGGRWCVAMLKATDPKLFDVSKREVIFTAESLRLEGVKDPWIMELNGTYHMILSVAIHTPKTSDQSHATLDIFNTGECISATALATSKDLDNWEWQGVIFKPEASGAWDCYCRRINSIVPSGGRYFAFYDGSASHLENYEEKTGIAVSNDLRTWKSLTQTKPAYTSPHASTSLRYIDAQLMGGQIHIFYEFAREDGAHDMRVVEVNDLPFTKDGEFDLSKYAPQIFIS